MNDREILKLIRVWITDNGRSESLSRLISAGVGARTAEALVSGEYKRTPSSMLRKILLDILKERHAS